MNLLRLLERPARAALVVAATLCAVGCQMAANGNNVEGVRLFQQGQYPAAMQRFQQALAADPQNADAYYNLAATFHRLGKSTGDAQTLAQAESYYNRCLDLNSEHVDCHRGLAGLLVETNRSDRAFNLLKLWKLRNPTSADACIELARLSEESGDVQTAEQQLVQAVQTNQYNDRAWRALAALQEKKGNTLQAVANYQRSLALNRFQPDVATRVAMLQGAPYAGSFQASPTGTRWAQPTFPTQPRY